MDGSHLLELVRRYAGEIDEMFRWDLQNTLSHQFERGDPIVFPQKGEIDWPKTIKRKLRHYQTNLVTIFLKRNYFLFIIL